MPPSLFCGSVYPFYALHSSPNPVPHRIFGSVLPKAANLYYYIHLRSIPALGYSIPASQPDTSYSLLASARDIFSPTSRLPKPSSPTCA